MALGAEREMVEAGEKSKKKNQFGEACGTEGEDEGTQ